MDKYVMQNLNALAATWSKKWSMPIASTISNGNQHVSICCTGFRETKFWPIGTLQEVILTELFTAKIRQELEYTEPITVNITQELVYTELFQLILDRNWDILSCGWYTFCCSSSCDKNTYTYRDKVNIYFTIQSFI